MFTKEFVTKQLCEGGIDAIMGLIHALEVKPMIDEVIREFDFEKVATIICNTTDEKICPVELRAVATKMLIKVAKGFEDGESKTEEHKGLIAEYLAPGDGVENENGELHLRYVAEASSAEHEDLSDNA